jgi:hypothetical protein
VCCHGGVVVADQKNATYIEYPSNGECVSIRNNVNIVTVDRPAGAGIVCTVRYGTVLCKNKHYLNVEVFFTTLL